MIVDADSLEDIDAELTWFVVESLSTTDEDSDEPAIRWRPMALVLFLYKFIAFPLWWMFVSLIPRRPLRLGQRIVGIGNEALFGYDARDKGILRSIACATVRRWKLCPDYVELHLLDGQRLRLDLSPLHHAQIQAIADQLRGLERDGCFASAHSTD